MHIDGFTWEEGINLLTYTFCLNTSVTGVSSSKDLYAIAVDFVASLHDFLPTINDGSRVGLLFLFCHNRTLGGPAVGLMLLFGGSSGFVVSLFLGRGLRGCGLLRLGRYWGHRGLWTVDEFVDGILFLKSLGEGCLCAGCKDATSTQQSYGYEAFHFFQASMIPLKSAAFSEAPPMRPPSMSGFANNSGALLALQEPP